MIEIAELIKGYDPSNVVLSIDDWRLEPPTHVALVGANGSGKTTLLLLIAGFLKPTTGSILVHGHPAGSKAARSLVSFVPDRPALFDDLTVGEQMSYVARLNGLSQPFWFAEELVAALDAAPLLERFPRSLSKGQRQKAGLLTAVARPFSVLLLDEPTSGLDDDSHEALIEAVDHVSAQDGVIVVSATHDQRLINLCKQVWTVSDGQLIPDNT